MLCASSYLEGLSIMFVHFMAEIVTASYFLLALF